MPASEADVTRLLTEWTAGNLAARDQLIPLVYDELREIAGRWLRRERTGHTLQPTALVHEAYLRLVDQRRVRWRDRAHFFAVAATTMRRVLVDHARRRGAAKRGGGAATIPIDDEVLGTALAPDILALDEALSALAALDERQVRIVELRVFAGLTIEEAAEVLRLSPSTIKADWSLAKAWLYRELHEKRGA
ncbi:MAG TPA: sigma-70 family RNA polymerase sigma factor [Vicinamibacterales bacterium]|nr:sigma-70 family RNA polymerase sigma factor [Vicinamibacterales bacterium]